MSAFYAPLRGIQNAIDQIVMLDSQMTELRRVMDATPQTYNKLMNESIALATELGNRVEDVNQAMVEFARQGYDPSTLIALTETATVAANISELTTTEAMSSLTAAMKSFNIEANDSLSILDRLNEVDNNFAISTKTISDALERSSSTARTFGIELDELIGLISAIGITTRESGSVVGNSLKTISSRITTMQPSIDALAEIGINVKDSAGEMRSTFDILEQLAGQWSSLSAEQQQNMAVTLAGRFQLSRFLVLMQQWQTVADVTTTSLNSQGSAMREQEEYSKSLEARLNRLSNTGVELSQALGDAILTDSLVVFTEAISSLANSSEELIRFVGLLAPTFGALATVLALVSTRFRTAIIDMNIFKTSATGLTISLTGLKTALRGLLISTGIGAAFAILGFGIEKLINTIGNHIQKQEELQKISQTSMDSLREERDTIDELVNEYEKLSNIERDNEQEARYVQLQNELAELLPAVKTGEDEKGNAIIASTEAVKDHIEVLERQLEIENKARQAEAQATISSNRDDITERISELKELEKAYEDSVEAYNNVVNEYDSESDQGMKDTLGQDIVKDLMDRAKADLTEFQQENVEIINEVTQAYATLAQSIDGISVSDSNIIAQLAMDANLTETEVIELAQRVESLKQTLGDSFSFSGIDGLDQLSAIEDVTSSVQNGSKNWSDFSNTLKEANVSSETISNTLGHLRNSEQDVANAAAQAGQDIRLATPAFNELGEIAGWVTEQLEEQEESIDQLMESYNQATSNIKALNGVINELNEGHGISADSVATLMEKYPQLLAYINDEAELRKHVQQEIENEAKISQQAVVEKMKHNEQFYNQMLKANATFYNDVADNYNIDLRNFTSLAQAKAEVENRLLKSLASAWGSYYQTQADGQAKLYVQNDSLVRGGMQGSSEANNILGQMRDQVNAYNSIISGLNSVAVGVIGVNFSGIGLSAPKSSSGSSKKESDAAKKAEEAQRRVLEVIQAQIEAYKRKIDALNDDIAHEEYYASKYEETSHQFRQRQENIAKLMKRQADYHKQTISYIEGQLKSNKRLNTEQRRELEATLIQTRQTYYSTLSSIDSINKEILQSYQTIADQIVEAYKEAYEKQKEIAIEANENELRILQDAHNKKLKMLDDEMSQYEKLIQAKLKSMDKDKESANHAERLAEMQKERLEIERQIRVLSMDDSMEGRNRVRDLQKELERVQKEISDFNSEREYEARRESLQDQLDAKREQIDAERELENSNFEDQQAQLQKDREIIERHYEDLLNDERKFAQIRQQIMNDNTKNITNTMKQFSKDIKNNMEIIGSSISRNLLDKLSEAQELLAGIKFTSGSSIVNTPGGMPQSFDTGGFTGNFSGGKLGILHEKELILNKNDTGNMLKTVSLVRDFARNIPKLGNVKNPTTNNNNQNTIHLNVEMHGVNDTKKFYKELNSGLQTLGVQFR